ERLEPRIPHALTLALGAHPVHAVVPVACAHERQAMLAPFPAIVQGPAAVLVQRPQLARDRRLAEQLLLLGSEQGSLEERHLLVEDSPIAGRTRIVTGNE